MILVLDFLSCIQLSDSSVWRKGGQLSIESFLSLKKKARDFSGSLSLKIQLGAVQGNYFPAKGCPFHMCNLNFPLAKCQQCQANPLLFFFLFGRLFSPTPESWLQCLLPRHRCLWDRLVSGKKRNVALLVSADTSTSPRRLPNGRIFISLHGHRVISALHGTYVFQIGMY